MYLIWHNSKTIFCTKIKENISFHKTYHQNNIEKSCNRQYLFVPGMYLVFLVRNIDSILFIHLVFFLIGKLLGSKLTEILKNIPFHISLNLTSGYTGLHYRTQVHRRTALPSTHRILKATTGTCFHLLICLMNHTSTEEDGVG